MTTFRTVAALVPGPIAEAIDAGITPAKAYRIYSDTSIADLAARTHLETRRLCQIEAGLAPTRYEAEAIRRALRIPAGLDAAAARF